MNKIIPFNKEIKFEDKIGEITSIALDDTLKFIDSYTIGGELIVRGCHKYMDIEDDFSYPIPTSIAVDDKYDTSKTTISIDDFYYEIINDDTLKVKIDILLDNLFFKEQEIEPVIEEVKVLNDRDEEIKEETNIVGEEPSKDYSVYRVYVVTYDDGLEDILEKFHITKEELANYNDISNIKPGMKIIIPSIDE